MREGGLRDPCSRESRLRAGRLREDALHQDESREGASREEGLRDAEFADRSPSKPSRDSTPDRAALYIGAENTTLSRGAALVDIGPGWERLAREHFAVLPVSAVAIERAIDVVEEALMRVQRELHRVTGASESHAAAANREARVAIVASDDPTLQAIARVAGSDAATLLSRDQVESVFQRIAAVALGRPAAQDDLPADARFAATVLILREAMHHLGIESIELL